MIPDPLHKFVKAAFFGALAVSLVGLSFLAGYLYQLRQSERLTFPLFEEAYTVVQKNGWKALPEQAAVEYGLIRGLLQAYDEPYTSFLEPPQNELESNRLSGKYGGIGASIEQDKDGYWMLFPYPDSPAAKAGVKDLDRLLMVDNLQITPQSKSDDVIAALRGPVGSRARLSVGRAPDYNAISLEVERSEIPLPSVTYRLAPDQPLLGVIKVNWIAATTADEIQEAVNDLQKNGATHFVLDLRDNPGGLLDAGVNIARLFLRDGVVMQQQYKGRDVETYRVEKLGPLADLPLAVLINKGSASAAEIAAGALQAQGRAKLIGEPSYGKDTIQLVFTLQDGSSLHVTAAHWWIPGLELPLAGNGLQPDIRVATEPAGPGNDPVLQAAIRLLFEGS